MPMYKIIEYSDTYSKTSGDLWKIYRDEPAFNDEEVAFDFLADNINSILFKFKQEMTGPAGITGTKDVEIIVPLIYLSNFWRIL